MTGPTPTSPHRLQPVGFPLALGAAKYADLMRGQLEMTMQLTAAWTASMSALSSKLLTQRPAVGAESSGAAQSAFSDGLRSLRSMLDVDPHAAAAPDRPATDFPWTRAVFDRPATGGMLRWLTAPPTLQTNLFDETIELLLDEDIKTAS